MPDVGIVAGRHETFLAMKIINTVLNVNWDFFHHNTAIAWWDDKERPDVMKAFWG